MARTRYLTVAEGKAIGIDNYPNFSATGSIKGMKDKDIAVIEGVRGLYEGIDSINDIGSTASIAKLMVYVL